MTNASEHSDNPSAALCRVPRPAISLLFLEMGKWAANWMLPDAPAVAGDSDYGHRIRAFQTGYIQSMIETVTDRSLYGAH